MKLASKLVVGKYVFLKYLGDFALLCNIISAILYNLLNTVKIFLATCSITGARTTSCCTLIWWVFFKFFSPESHKWWGRELGYFALCSVTFGMTELLFAWFGFFRQVNVLIALRVQIWPAQTSLLRLPATLLAMVVGRLWCFCCILYIDLRKLKWREKIS